MELLTEKIKIDRLFLVMFICVAGFSISYILNSYLSSRFFTLPEVRNIEDGKKVEKFAKGYDGLYYLFRGERTVKKAVSYKTTETVNQLKDLKLVGVVLGGGGKLAFISSKKGITAVKEGDSIEGYTLKEIKKREVILQSRSKRYILTVEPADIKPSGRHKVSSDVSEEVIKVDKRFVQEKTEDIGKLLKDVLLVPEIKNGETVGFRFRYIKPKSVLYKLGLRSGDLIISVNDMPVRTAEEAFKIYNMLRNEEYVKVVIERRGKRKVLTYEIR
ncbi:PDZ domain-containing protein [Persephonella sp.]